MPWSLFSQMKEAVINELIAMSISPEPSSSHLGVVRLRCKGEFCTPFSFDLRQVMECEGERINSVPPLSTHNSA